MDAKTQRIAVLKGAIGHMRCVISEPWQSVESQRIAKDNLAKYRKELFELESQI